VSFAAITLYIASQRVFVVVVVVLLLLLDDFVIDSVRKRLDTPSYDPSKLLLTLCSSYKRTHKN
jgi:hypothetical protein